MEEIMDILLIESRATSAHTIQAMLDDCQNIFHKQWTYSLADAISILGEKKFNCILTNVQLSEADGSEIIQQLTTRAPTTPIIALVENGSWEIGKIMIAAGAQDFIIKEEMSPLLLRKTIIYSIERQKLTENIKSLTIRDELTNLFNRRGFKQLAEQQLNIAQRTGRPCTLMFVDLDNLKIINDTHGHPVGDLAICEMADILRELLRTSDIIARLGGDEFVVMAPDTIYRHIDNITTRINHRLQNRDEKIYKLNASVGVVTYRKGKHNLDELILQACKQMYLQKNAKKLAGDQ